MSKKIIGITVGTTMNPKKIAEKIEGGTTLPMVTEQDNGKILTVKNGKWESDNLPTYDGAIVITPSISDVQTLLTEGKYNDANITVDKITVSKVSNTSGGNTIVIGG